MGAPKGNKFWELRSKHGRDKIFETPDLMWEAACEYFEWCQNNPFHKVEQSRSKSTKKNTEIGNDGIEVKDTGLIEIPIMRPFTMKGISLYFGETETYLKDFIRREKKKEDQKSKDFVTVTTRIKDIIYNQQFSGSASGFLNPNIIARNLGLSDKVETKSKLQISPYEDLTEQELKAEIDRLTKGS